MAIGTAESRRRELEAQLPELVNRLKAIGAKKIVLFGSLARGEVWRGSDIDLLVVLDRPGRFLDRLDIVYDAMAARVGVDAIVYTSEEFAELVETRPFVRQALAGGRVLYDSDVAKATLESPRQVRGRAALPSYHADAGADTRTTRPPHLEGAMNYDPSLEGRRWLEQAEDDLRAARLLADGGHHNLACFQAQQVAEKALKAVLYASGEREVLGHSSGDLAERAARARTELASVVPSARALDKFYIPTRYPNALPGGIPARSYTQEDSRRAIAEAEAILETCRRSAAMGEPEASR